MANVINSMKIKDSIKLCCARKKSKVEEQECEIFKTELKLPPIVTRQEADRIRWEIKSLPNDWVPVVKTSKVLTRFIRDKEVMHNSFILDKKNQMRSINLDIEEKIRSESAVYKWHLAESNSLIEDCLKKIKFTSKKCGRVVLSKEAFDNILHEIDITSNETLMKTQQLYNKLQAFEKERTERFKKVLRDCYEHLHEVSFKLPYELQEFFEHEIMNINQITLSNYRVYEDLNLQLNLRIENDKRLWLRNYHELLETYVESRKQYLRSIDKRLPLEFDVFTVEIEDESAIRDDTGAVITKEYLEEFIDKTTKRFLTYNRRLIQLKTIIRIVNEKIYLESFDEIQTLLPNISRASTYTDYDYEHLKANIYNSMFEDKIIVISQYTSDMIVKWTNLYNTIDIEMDMATLIIQEALHIWDKHYDRIFELKELTLLDLKKLTEKNLYTEEVEMMKINTSIDTLRQETTEESLNDNMCDIRKTVDQIMKVVINNTESEKQFFNKYRLMAENEAAILSLEIRAYLNKIVPYEDVDSTMQRGRGSKIELPAVVVQPFYMNIYENEVKLLHNWLYGLNESITRSAEKCEQSLLKHANSWIVKQCKILDRKLHLKQELIYPRFERIYYDIYNVRMIELQQHEQRLQHHISGIFEEIKRLSKINASYRPSYELAVEDFSNEIERLKIGLKDARHSSKIEGNINSLAYLKIVCLDKLDNFKREFDFTVHDRINNIKFANLNFMKSIRLFHEEGNYSTDELKYYKKELMNLSRNVKKDLVPIFKESIKLYSEFEAQVTKLEYPMLELLNHMLIELRFYEMYIKEIKRTQNLIKKQTYELKVKYKLIESSFKQLKYFAYKHIGSLQYLDEFTENCEYMEKAFNDVRGLILQTEMFKLNMNLFAIGRRLSKDSNASNIKEQIEEMAMETDHFNMILFQNIPSGNDYMSSVINILYNSLTDLQEKAMEFYNTGNLLITEKFLPPTLTKFMIDVLAKYLYYQLQCEKVWLETAIDYLLIVDQVLNFISGYYKESTRAFIKEQLKTLKTLCENYLKDVSDDSEEIDLKYRNIHNKLKPLHGYVYNGEMLHQLNDEMIKLDQYVINLQSGLLAKRLEFQEIVVDNVNTFQTEIVIVEARLKASLDEYLQLIVRDDELVFQINDRTTYLRQLVTTKYKITSTNDEYLAILGELSKKVDQLKQGLKINSEHIIHLSANLSKIILTKQHYSNVKFQESFIDGNDLDLNIEKIVEEYRVKQEKCLKEVFTEKDLLSISQKWNILWQNDIEKIKRLYTVKYPRKKSGKDDNRSTR